ARRRDLRDGAAAGLSRTGLDPAILGRDRTGTDHRQGPTIADPHRAAPAGREARAGGPVLRCPAGPSGTRIRAGGGASSGGSAGVAEPPPGGSARVAEPRHAAQLRWRNHATRSGVGSGSGSSPTEYTSSELSNPSSTNSRT